MAALAGVIHAEGEAGAGSAIERMLFAQRHRGESRSSTRIALRTGWGELACLDHSASSRSLAERDGCALVLGGSVSSADELRGALAAEGASAPQATAAQLVLDALIRWGTAALPRIHGSWALVFVDSREDRVWLARDHFGGAPLYFFSGARGLAFASEIKGILNGTGERFAADPEVVGRFLDQTLLDIQPETFFAGIRAVPAGHIVSLDCSGPPPWKPQSAPFWQMPDRDRFIGSERQRIAAVREGLGEAVRRQLHGGDRIGLLVSGGIDSSAVAAAACASRRADLLLVSRAELRDPHPMIVALSRHLDRETHRFPIRIATPDALRELEVVIGASDEPVGNFDVVVDYRLKEAARALGVSVLMGGYGSDELFAGKVMHMVFYVQWLLRSGRVFEAARVAMAIARRRTIRPRFRIAYQKRYFRSLDRKRIDVGGRALAAHRGRGDLGLGARIFHERLIEEITRFSLPSLLRHEDRMSMAFGIENRYAFLHPPLVELVAPMAPEWKLRDGFTKWLLRKAVERLLPREICWQKASQSSGRDEYGDWLKRDLHPQIAKLIGGDLAAVEFGLLDRDAVRRHYAAFCAQPSGVGAISAHDVFSWIAIELWARRFAPHLRAP
jgi:asparagine synthase (glutamine-hydrolysing)